MVECPRGTKTRKRKLFRYILKTYSYIGTCSKSRYLDGKEKPKKTREKQITKKKKRKDKRIKEGKIKIRKEKENIKENQEAADKNLPGVQAHCAVFFGGGGMVGSLFLVL